MEILMQDFKTLFYSLRTECTTSELLEKHDNLTLQLQNGYCGHMVAYDCMKSFIDASKPKTIIDDALNELLALYAETAPHLIVKHIIKVSQKFRLVPREEQAMLDAFDEFIGAPKAVPLTQEDIDNL